MMDLNILEIGRKIKFMGMANIHGMMEDNMKVNGKKTTWMDMVYTPGRMVGNLKVNTKEIRSTERESTPGQMAGNMMENEKMEGKTVKVNIFLKQVNLEKVYGRMERELDGWTIYKMTIDQYISIL